MVQKITIRRATEADAERIHELINDSIRTLCSTVYSEEIIEGWLKNRTPEIYRPNIESWGMYVAESEGEIIGVGGVVPVEIVISYVAPDNARRGLGTMLVNHGLMIANVKPPGVIRVQSTLNARPFYEAMGFKVVKDIKLRRNDIELPCFEMERAGDAT